MSNRITIEEVLNGYKNGKVLTINDGVIIKFCKEKASSDVEMVDANEAGETIL